MKKVCHLILIMLGIFSISPILVFAEFDQTFIVDAECTTVLNDTSDILIDSIQITESSADAFGEDTQFEFCVKNMDFVQEDAIEISQDSLCVEYFVDEGSMVITINNSDPEAVESILLPNITLKPKSNRILPVGTYQLYRVYENTNQKATKIPILSEFIKVEAKTVFPKRLIVEVRILEKKLLVDGIEKNSNIQVYNSNEKYVMLPLREIEAIYPEAKVLWDHITKKATILCGDKIISIGAEESEMSINGVFCRLQKASNIKDDRMYLSLQDICRMLGVQDQDIQWDENTRTVLISINIMNN